MLEPADGERDARARCRSGSTGSDQITSSVRAITRVDPAAEVAGEQAEDDGEDGRDQGRGDADQQRGPAAVHQPHHLVAAEAAVGAEEELAAGAEPLRPDRLAFGRDDVALLRRRR